MPTPLYRNTLSALALAACTGTAMCEPMDKATAASPDPEAIEPMLNDDTVLAYAGRVVPPMTGPTLPSENKSQTPPSPPPPVWPHALPFFAQRVIDRGIDLPNPYDVGISIYTGREDRKLGSLEVGFNGSAPLDASFVQFPKTRVQTQSTQVQIGAWLFPFLSVYGIAGYTKGDGDIDIAVSGQDLMQFLGVPGCNLSPGLRPDLCSQTLTGTAHAHYDGTTVGLGATVAGAHRNLFFAMPVSYVVSYLSVSSTPSKTWNIAPRLGYNQHLSGQGMLTWYAGGTYMLSDIHITGSFVFDTTATAIGKPTTMSYNIKVEPKDPWNYLAGVNWTVNKQWSAMAEMGFGGSRQDVLLTAFYRF